METPIDYRIVSTARSRLRPFQPVKKKNSPMTANVPNKTSNRNQSALLSIMAVLMNRCHPGLNSFAPICPGHEKGQIYRL